MVRPYLMDYTDCSLLVARNVVSDETIEAVFLTSGQTKLTTRTYAVGRAAVVACWVRRPRARTQTSRREAR